PLRTRRSALSDCTQSREPSLLRGVGRAGAASIRVAPTLRPAGATREWLPSAAPETIWCGVSAPTSCVWKESRNESDPRSRGADEVLHKEAQHLRRARGADARRQGRVAHLG